MRILVTGSRTWRDGTLIRTTLTHYLTTLTPGTRMTVVHGACRSGADMYADGWARWHHRHGKPVDAPEVHPAPWEGPCRDTCRPGHRRPDPRGWDVCPQAGFYRNEHMVNLGADVCLAFIADRSKGATHCAERAEKAGIPVVPFYTDTVADALF